MEEGKGERERERSSYLVRKLALTRNLVKARLVLAGGWVSALRISFGREKTMKSTYLCFIFVSPSLPLFPLGHFPLSSTHAHSLSLSFLPLLPVSVRLPLFLPRDSKGRSGYAGETSSFCEAESPEEEEEAIEISKRSRPRGAIL